MRNFQYLNFNFWYAKLSYLDVKMWHVFWVFIKETEVVTRRFSKKFHKIHRKASVPESFFNKLEIDFSDQYTWWFRSYLCERIFFVELENQLSDYRKISCGVPQGSVLGLLLYLIYVNDMSQPVKLNLFLYGDDSVSFTNIEISKTLKNN